MRKGLLLFLLILSVSTGLAAPQTSKDLCASRTAALFESGSKPALLPGSSAPIGTLQRVAGATDWGPKLELQLGVPSGRRVDQLDHLVIGQYNVLDLVPHGERALGKPDKDLRGVAETIRRAEPDILVVEEIGSVEILAEFATSHLGSKYEPLLIEGNGGGIHVGFLLKKDLPFDVEAQSFKNVADSTDGDPLFSRDLPVLVFRERGGDARGPPRLAVAGTHFKSQRTSDPTIDTAAIRARQAKGASEILKHYQEQLGPAVPVILAGDFNDDLRHAPAFSSLKDLAGFRDSFDLAPADKSVPITDRTTQTFHPRDGSPTVWSQLDGILVSGVSAESRIIREAQVVPYLDENGKIKPIPRTREERHQNPSDHFMLRAVIDYSKLRALGNP